MSNTFKTSHSEPVLILKNHGMNYLHNDKFDYSKLNTYNFNNNNNNNNFNNNSSISNNNKSNNINNNNNNSNNNNNNVIKNNIITQSSNIPRPNIVKRNQTFQHFATFNPHNPYFSTKSPATGSQSQFLNVNMLSSPFTMPTYFKNQVQPQPQLIKENSNIQSYDSQNFLHPNAQAFCIRFAVNGLSKFTKGGSVPPINKNIQAGDFGDDSGMIAENSRCIVIGLADGAGGNRNIGIDPQKFSRSLLGYSVEIIKSEEIMPNQMARLACKSIHILESQHIDGSGTLCLLALNKHTNLMHSLNIGDSGFRLLRQGQIVHKSEATMAGSSPKQLYVSDSSNYNGISFVTEEEILQDSSVKEFPVRKGDILVLSSDGMFDVVQDHVIEKVVKSHDERDLQGIADDLLSTAMKSYIHTQRDDILIIVCRVEPKKQQN